MSNQNTNYINYLIDLAKTGARRSYLDLCEITMRNIYTLCFRLTLSEKDASEVTKIIFSSVWETINNYNSEITFSAWLESIAVRDIIVFLHSKPSIYEFDKQHPLYNDPTEFAIASLEKDERIVFILHDMEGYSYKEISSFFFDKSVDEIISIIIDARQKLIKAIII
ncbi:MAG: RNA polymerase sigma factor [Melioribacteraceae bacterium]|nr:RNA polymerase sigma factor [Melioribacteraceae bacterium]